MALFDAISPNFQCRNFTYTLRRKICCPNLQFQKKICSDVQMILIFFIYVDSTVGIIAYIQRMKYIRSVNKLVIFGMKFFDQVASFESHLLIPKFLQRFDLFQIEHFLRVSILGVCWRNDLIFGAKYFKFETGNSHQWLNPEYMADQRVIRSPNDRISL